VKRTPISRKPSAKQKVEIKKRTDLHHELLIEQGNKCAKCGRYLKYYQSELSHKEHSGMGGCKDKSVTNKENCEVTCASWLAGCHPNEEHGLHNIYNEQPQWGK